MASERLKVFLDTTPVLLLYEGQAESVSAEVRDALDQRDRRVSPMVRLELAYLNETDRITDAPDTILGALRAEFGVRMQSDPIESVIARAIPINWTRDPFDRLIVATADLHDAVLLTRDRQIRHHYAMALW